jgi:hypothetical protein
MCSVEHGLIEASASSRNSVFEFTNNRDDGDDVKRPGLCVLYERLLELQWVVSAAILLALGLENVRPSGSIPQIKCHAQRR